MKKIFLLTVIHIMAIASFAQYKINLILSNTPPATLSEWSNRREVLTLIVTGQGSAAFEVKIKTEIKAVDGTVIGTTDLAKAKAFTFTAATTILTANDVLPLDNMIFTGKYRKSLDKTGKLPSDNYTLCVQLVRLPDYAPASDQQCKGFFLANLQLPILMKPYNEEKLDEKLAQTAITFRWTPIVPQQNNTATYRVQVFEVLERQTPMQALRSNQPLLDKEIRGATQYIWRPQLGMMEGKDVNAKGNEKNINTSEAGVGTGKGGIKKSNTNGDAAAKNINTSEAGVGTGKGGITATFIWTIQTLDTMGNPIIQTDGNGEARSEPLIFYIEKKN